MIATASSAVPTRTAAVATSAHARASTHLHTRVALMLRHLIAPITFAVLAGVLRVSILRRDCKIL